MRKSSRIATIVLAASFTVLLFDTITTRTDSGRFFRLYEAQTDVRNLGLTVELFVRDHGVLPTNEEGFGVLVSSVPQLIGRVPPDPWGRAYVYRRIAVAPNFEIHSFGRNGIDERGSGDDITLSAKSYRCEDYDVNCGVAGKPFWLGVLVALFLASLAVLAFDLIRLLVRTMQARPAK